MLLNWPVVFYTSGSQFSSVQSLSRVRLFITPWTAARQASLSITNSQSLLKLMPIESVMPSIHLILCHPLLLLPSIFPSIRVFSNESTLRIRWPKYWSFSFNISPSNEYTGLISFRMDWLDLLAVQGTLKSLLQHHSSKTSSLQHSAFFTVQLSQPYMTTGKTIVLTKWTFVGKVMFLLLMATHSSILAWKISWTEEPGGLQSMGSQSVRDDWATDTLLTYLLQIVVLMRPLLLIRALCKMRDYTAKWLLLFSCSVVSNSLWPHWL